MGIDYVLLDSCGNRYVAIDGRNSTGDWGELAKEMSRPRSLEGVGSDGIVLLLESNMADARTRIFNPDGSEAEMSGNGIRLLSKFAIDHGYVRVPSPGDYLTIETMDGVKEVWPEMDSEGKMARARVGMGPATFTASEVPVKTQRWSGVDQVIAQSVNFGEIDLDITCLAIGNPHAVAILDQPVEDFPLRDVGQLVENHAMFPQRINFEIVNVLDRGNIKARIFERGAGETPSSGTGSTAAAFASRKLGHVDDEVNVLLDGGILHITWDDYGNAYCTGVADEIESGTWQSKLVRQNVELAVA